MLATLAPSTYLGPARVAAIEGDRLQLAFPDQQVWAVSALAVPYRPAVGDVVLAIGQDEAWYVLGVIKGKGETTLMAPGNLKLMAPHGRIELVAGAGVRVYGPTVQLVADKVEVTARYLLETLGTASRWVKQLFHLRAGQAHVTVEDTYQVKAGRIVERAEGDVRIDGRHIHLG